MPYTGTLLAESLRRDAVLAGVPLNVQRIWRSNAGDAAAGQPLTWTFIEFEVPEASAGLLAELLSTTLAPGPWYCDFRNDREIVVTFAGRASGISDVTSAHAKRPRLMLDPSGSPSRRSTGPRSPDHPDKVLSPPSEANRPGRDSP
jgi:hypothetical protein